MVFRRRRTRVQANKPHKSPFSSNSRNIHKGSRRRIRIIRIQTNNKTIRQQQKGAAPLLQQQQIPPPPPPPPCVILLFPLYASVKLDPLEDDLCSLFSSKLLPGGPAISVLKAPHGNLLSCMEMLKVADLLVFVASASESCQQTHSRTRYIDSFGDQCLSVFRSLGLPTTVLFIRDLPELKQRNELKKISSSLAPKFPEDCKCYPADTKDDLHKFLRLFKEQRLKVPHWRTHRSYLMAHKVDVVCDAIFPDKCTLLLTGYIRGRNLSVNQQVHVSGAGDFQLCKIEVLENPFLLNSRKNQDLMDSDETHDIEVIRCLVPDPQNQTVVVKNDEEQTWPPEADTSTADEDQQQKTPEADTSTADEDQQQKTPEADTSTADEEVDTSTADEDQQQKKRKRKLPPGTSAYQAAWYFHDFNEEKSDGDSEKETDNLSMMEVDNMTRENIQDELKAIKEDNAADEEFPDEVDTPLDVPARTRFAKYRHLKSVRNSSWEESLPKDYPRNFNYHNFKRTQKHVLAKALEMEQENREDCVPVGSYIRLHIMDVPNVVASKLCELAKTNPVTASGLLEHECEVSVLHFSVKKHETYQAPIKSKEELIFHVGFRQFVGRPIFSTEFGNTNKNKMERFLRPGCFSVASVCAKISFPPLPTIILKRIKRTGEDDTLAVAAFGSLKTVDRDRIILKRVILTGYPQRVSKRKASVKHMFYNPDDVKFFKPVELYTKHGLRGRIKEPVGTHGAMKCLLNGVLEQRDTVCMNLYKRVYPKFCKEDQDAV